MNILKKMRYEAYKYCENVLIKERDRAERNEQKYLERINEDITLTERQFNELQVKKDHAELQIDQLTYGIRLLSEEIKGLRYQINMESEE